MLYEIEETHTVDRSTFEEFLANIDPLLLQLQIETREFQVSLELQRQLGLEVDPMG